MGRNTLSFTFFSLVTMVWGHQDRWHESPPSTQRARAPPAKAEGTNAAPVAPEGPLAGTQWVPLPYRPRIGTRVRVRFVVRGRRGDVCSS